MSSSIGQVQYFPLDIRSSAIHGKGIFAKTNIPSGMLVYASDDYSITPSPIYASIQRSSNTHLLDGMLRWENHSCEPNSYLQFDDRIIQLITVVSVESGQEIVCDYRNTEDSIPAEFRCNCGYCDGSLIK